MLRFRAATAKDVQPILDLWAASRSDHAETPDSAEAIRRLLDTDPGSLLVAEDGDQIQGALIAAFDGWRGNMYRLAVRPDRRREGIATRLVQLGEQRLRHSALRRSPPSSAGATRRPNSSGAPPGIAMT